MNGRVYLLLLGTLLLPQLTHAQDTIPLYTDAIAQRQRSLAGSRRPFVGVDLSRGVWWVWSALRTEQTPVYHRPVSLQYYWPIRSGQAFDQHAYVSAGYAAYAGTLQRTVYQRGHSAHVRAGIEQNRNGLLLGYGGLLAGWSGDESMLFKGPAFGDYLQRVGRLKGLLLGGELHVGGEVCFNPAVRLRLVARGTIFARTGNQPDVPPPYLSGLDLLSSRPVGVAGILNAALVFRL